PCLSIQIGDCNQARQETLSILESLGLSQIECLPQKYFATFPLAQRKAAPSQCVQSTCPVCGCTARFAQRQCRQQRPERIVGLAESILGYGKIVEDRKVAASVARRLQFGERSLVGGDRLEGGRSEGH